MLFSCNKNAVRNFSRRQRVFGPTLSRWSDAIIERKFLPNGSTLVTSFSQVQPASGFTANTYPDIGSTDGSTTDEGDTEALTCACATVIGTPAMDWGFGYVSPAVSNLTAHERGSAELDSTLSSSEVDIDVTHTGYDEVTADSLAHYSGGYGLEGLEGPYVGESTHVTTQDDPYVMNLGGSGTIDVTFTLSLTAQENKFFDSASMHLSTSHLEVWLGTNGALNGAPAGYDQTGFVAIDPTTNTVLVDDPDFDSDYQGGTEYIHFTAPAPVTEDVQFSSVLGTSPLGGYDGETDVQNSTFEWTFDESYTP